MTDPLSPMTHISENSKSKGPQVQYPQAPWRALRLNPLRTQKPSTLSYLVGVEEHPITAVNVLDVREEGEEQEQGPSVLLLICLLGETILWRSMMYNEWSEN